MILHRIDLNLLVILDALLRERSVTRAAKVVGLSQPAVSAALARLRGFFRDRLLVRSGRGYDLTPFAAELIVPLQDSLSSLERTIDRSSAFDPESATRTFRIAASDYTMLVLMQRVVERVSQAAPRIKLHFRINDARAPDRLANGRLDLAIQPAGVLQNLPAQALYDDAWTCAVWAGNTEIRDEISAEQWRTLPHASFGHGHEGTFLGDCMLGPFSIERRRQLISESYVSLPFLIRGTRAVALIPERLGKLLARAGDIRLVTPPFGYAKFTQSMSWNPLYSDDPASQWLRSLVQQAALELR